MMPTLSTITHTYPNAALAFFGLLALLLGSMLTMLVYRLPIILGQSLLRPQSDTFSRFNLFLPRSHCPQCKTMIPGYYNIPVLGYCLLKGCCHACRKRIAWRYPLIEILTLGLFLAAELHFGWHPSLMAAGIFISFCIAMTFIDLEHQLIPDSLSLGLLWLGLLINTQDIFCSLNTAVISAAGGYLSLWLFIRLYYLLTGKIGMGHGDFKLFAAFGAWFGWMALGKILLLSCILGSIIGWGYLKITGQHSNTAIAFGPFLSLAALIYLFSL